MGIRHRGNLFVFSKQSLPNCHDSKRIKQPALKYNYITFLFFLWTGYRGEQNLYQSQFNFCGPLRLAIRALSDRQRNLTQLLHQKQFKKDFAFSWTWKILSLDILHNKLKKMNDINYANESSFDSNLSNAWQVCCNASS